MPSLHLVDPEFRPLLDMMPQTEMTAATLPDIRAMFAQQIAAAPVPDTPDVTVGEQRVPGAGATPPVRVVVYRPSASSDVLPAILHIHGGGYVIGTPEVSDAQNRDLAARLGCVIVSVDYRLSPETAHPGPVEDCYAALRWLHQGAAALQVDPARIGIMGESAGGGLAAALALLARDRGEVPIAFQHLVYPMLDDRTCTDPDPNPFSGEFVWSRAANRFGWSALLGTEPGSAGVSPYAAAARAENLAGLPPCFIATAALDLFVDEDIAYATRLLRAGVPVELHIYPGAFHGFHMLPTARVTERAERDSREALARALHG